MFEELKKIYANGKPSKLICKKHKKQYDYLLFNTQFLDDQIIGDYNIKIVQRLYHLIFNIKYIPKCKFCGNLVEFNSNREYRIYCSNTCKVKDANYVERTAKGKNTKFVNHGDPNYNNSEKRAKTNMQRYGGISPTSSEEIKKKSKQTKIENHGDPYFSNWEKGKQTCQKRYNVNSNLWIKEIREKIKSDNIKKYGYDHHTKSPDYVQGFNNKKYNFLDKQITIQGYENLALDMLIPKYGERDIIIGKHEIFKKLGRIEYTHKNKVHVYFPDIFIISKNLIIEVKSQWTFDSKKEINLLKREACLKRGFNFNFWIFESQNSLKIL